MPGAAEGLVRGCGPRAWPVSSLVAEEEPRQVGSAVRGEEGRGETDSPWKQDGLECRERAQPVVGAGSTLAPL